MVNILKFVVDIFFFLPGCQRQETSSSCVDCRSQKEEVESLSSETECQKAPRIPKEEVWNLRQGKAEKSCGGRHSSCSCSTFSYKSPYHQVEEKGQHLDRQKCDLCTGFKDPYILGYLDAYILGMLLSSNNQNFQILKLRLGQEVVMFVCVTIEIIGSSVSEVLVIL